jgi:DNA polymerase III epsilon subunit-like protein
LHNASFDLPFLQRLVALAGRRPLWNPVVDTLGLARGLYGSGGNRLEELAPRHGVALERAHRALPDARAAAGMLLALAPVWERERGVRSLAELAAVSWDALRLNARRTGPGAALQPAGA